MNKPISLFAVGGKLLAAATATTLFLLLASCAGPEEITMVYFDRIACPSCLSLEPSEMVVARLGAAARSHDHLRLITYDVGSDYGRAALDEMAAEHGLAYRDLSLPVLFVNDTLLQGWETIDAYADTIQ